MCCLNCKFQNVLASAVSRLIRNPPRWQPNPRRLLCYVLGKFYSDTNISELVETFFKLTSN